MRRWIEEDNKGVEIRGIRWLTKENRPGKTASSLVIYARAAEEIGRLRMGRKLFRTTKYDWGPRSNKEGGRGGHRCSERELPDNPIED